MPRTPAPLTWVTLLPLDLSLAFTVIAVCMTLCLAQAPVILGKARLTGVLLGLATERGAAVERYALGGELIAPAAASAAAASDSSGGFAYRHSGTSVVASGVLRGGEATFQLAFNPAVGAADLGWSVIWLCGLRRAPPGLHAPAPPLAANLSAEQLPHVCRDTPT